MIARPVLDMNFQLGAVLGKADLGSSIEPQGKVDRIPDANECRVYLVGPDLKIGELRLAIDRGKRRVHRVETRGRVLTRPIRGTLKRASKTRHWCSR